MWRRGGKADRWLRLFRPGLCDTGVSQRRTGLSGGMDCVYISRVTGVHVGLRIFGRRAELLTLSPVLDHRTDNLYRIALDSVRALFF